MSGYELKIMKLELNTFSYIIVFSEAYMPGYEKKPSLCKYVQTRDNNSN